LKNVEKMDAFKVKIKGSLFNCVRLCNLTL
jgi:hypothetical protein